MGYSTLHQWIIERIPNIQKWLVVIHYYYFFSSFGLIGCLVTASTETCVTVSGLQPQQGYRFEVLFVFSFTNHVSIYVS